MKKDDQVLVEQLSTRGSRVNQEQGLIEDVLLLGAESKNGPRYGPATRSAAIPLFEGARVNLSHSQLTDGKRDLAALNRPVSLEKRVGRVKDVRDTPEGLRGSIKLLMKHPWTPVVLEMAADDPELFGCSPIMVGAVDNENNVTEIRRVKSVDFVADPATTKGLFEDEDPAGAGTSEDTDSASVHYLEACQKAVSDIITSVLAGDTDLGEGLKEIKDHLKDHLKRYGKPSQEETPAEGTDTPGTDKGMQEELAALRVERDCRVLCEELAVPVDKDLLAALAALPDSDRRRGHLREVKRLRLHKAPKAGVGPATDGPSPASKNFLSIIRGG